MSLRDQFLKAGLASKKQAKKAANDARIEKKKKGNKADEISKKIAEDLAKRKELDRQINQKREEEKQLIEKRFQVRQILLRNSMGCSQNPDHHIYYFIVDKTKIHSIRVSSQQQTQLEVGDIGIVKLDENSPYALLSRSHCERILEIDSTPVICLHSKLKDLPTEASN